MNVFTGKVAVVAGAPSGVGRSSAVELARRGPKLGDVNATELDETARQCEALGSAIKVDFVDVAEREAVLARADAVAHHFSDGHRPSRPPGTAYAQPSTDPCAICPTDTKDTLAAFEFVVDYREIPDWVFGPTTSSPSPIRCAESGRRSTPSATWGRPA